MCLVDLSMLWANRFLKIWIHLAKLVLNETDPETFEILNAEVKIKLSLLGLPKKFVLKRDLLID